MQLLKYIQIEKNAQLNKIARLENTQISVLATFLIELPPQMDHYFSATIKFFP